MTTFLTTDDFDSIITAGRDNLGGVGDSTRMQWYNFLNQHLYPKLVATNPNDYLIIRTIKTLINVSSYVLPTDFKNFRVGGVYKANAGKSTYRALNYDAETSPFTVGAILTGGTSGATGTIDEVVDYGTTGTLRLSSSVDAFEDDETITDDNGTPGSATVNGGGIPFDYGETQMVNTDFGSQSEGFWVSGQIINITPTPTGSSVIILRYVPTLAKLSDTNKTSIIPFDYEEFVSKATKAFLVEYREDQSLAFLSAQKFLDALNALLGDISKTPNIFTFRRNLGTYTN